MATKLWKSKNQNRIKKYRRDWYDKNKKHQIEKQKKRRGEIVKWIRQYKESKPCLDCNKKHPYYVMDFDHVKDEKEFGIGEFVRTGHSFKRLKEEIDKCDLVCANCHRKRTFGRIGV